MFFVSKKAYQTLYDEHMRVWNRFQEKIKENNIARNYLARITECTNAYMIHYMAKQALNKMNNITKKGE